MKECCRDSTILVIAILVKSAIHFDSSSFYCFNFLNIFNQPSLGSICKLGSDLYGNMIFPTDFSEYDLFITPRIWFASFAGPAMCYDGWVFFVLICFFISLDFSIISPNEIILILPTCIFLCWIKVASSSMQSMQGFVYATCQMDFVIIISKFADDKCCCQYPSYRLQKESVQE